MSASASVAASLSALSSLTALAMHGWQLESAALCLGIAHLPALEALTLADLNHSLRCGSRHTWYGSAALSASAPQLARLCCIRLHSWLIPTGEEAEALGIALGRLPAVSQLDLSSCSFQECTFVNLARRLSALTALRDLDLDNIDLEDDFMNYTDNILDALAALPNLQHLQCTYRCDFDSGRYNHLLCFADNLSRLTALTELDLSSKSPGAGLADWGACVRVTPVGSMPALRRLRIEAYEILEEPAVDALAEAVAGLPVLESLVLGDLGPESWAVVLRALLPPAPPRSRSCISPTVA